jgi:hypothetical protein
MLGVVMASSGESLELSPARSFVVLLLADFSSELAGTSPVDIVEESTKRQHRCKSFPNFPFESSNDCNDCNCNHSNVQWSRRGVTVTVTVTSADVKRARIRLTATVTYNS